MTIFMEEWWDDLFSSSIINTHPSLPDFENTVSNEVRSLAKIAAKELGSNLDDSTFDDIISFIEASANPIEGSLAKDLQISIYRFDIRCQALLGLHRQILKRFSEGNGVLASDSEFLIYLTQNFDDSNEPLSIPDGHFGRVSSYDDARYLRASQHQADPDSYDHTYSRAWSRLDRVSQISSNRLVTLLEEVADILEEIVHSNISTLSFHGIKQAHYRVLAIETYLSSIAY